MAVDNIKQEYLATMEKCRLNNELEQQFDGGDRRKSSRVKCSTDDLWINSVPVFSAVDVSAGGISIIANYPLQKGEEIVLALGSKHSVKAHVVDCTLVDSPTQHTDATFFMRCEFDSEESGMQMLVTIKNDEYDEAGTRPE